MKWSIAIICIMSLTRQTPYPDFKGKTFSEVAAMDSWRIIAEARGQLYRDRHEDIVLIVESKNTFEENRIKDVSHKNNIRVLLVLRHKDGAPAVVEQNNHFIARAAEGGSINNVMPAIVISKKKLIISFTFQRGEMSYTFKDRRNELEVTNVKKLTVSHYIYRKEEIDFERQMLKTESRESLEGPVSRKTIPLPPGVQTRKLSALEMIGTWEVSGFFF